MNCKPGDLALVLSNVRTRSVGIADLIVKVTELTVNFWDVPSWRFDCSPRFSPSGEPVTVIPDEMLRPLRDPGDDAQDETLQWLQVPTTEEVTA